MDRRARRNTFWRKITQSRAGEGQVRPTRPNPGRRVDHVAMEPGTTLLELVHRYVGYPTAFLVAPLALLAFTRPGSHRRLGSVFLGLMVFMYLSGTYRTLTHHDWDSWPVYRNLSFNFLGFQC